MLPLLLALLTGPAAAEMPRAKWIGNGLIDAGGSVSLDPVPVLCRLPRGQSAKEVTLYSPDREAPARIEVKAAGSALSFDVPVRTYTMAVIQW